MRDKPSTAKNINNNFFVIMFCCLGCVGILLHTMEEQEKAMGAVGPASLISRYLLIVNDFIINYEVFF